MMGRLLNGPDDAMRRCGRLVEREESPAGRDPFLIMGRKAAKACSRCVHKRHHVVSAKRGHGVIDRCMRCGAAWPWDTKYVMRGEVRISRRPQEFERRLVALADLELAICQIPRSDRMLYGTYLRTDRSYEFAAEKATELALMSPEQWPKPVGSFTRKRMIGAVARGRRFLREALQARGLMSRSVPVLMRDGRRELVDGLEPLPLDVVVSADPATWVGLLQDIAIRPEDLRGRALRLAVIRLSRSTTAKLGTVYHEVPRFSDRT